MSNKPELLSPAGSLEGVRAAVQSGANAVYMGYGSFNARRAAHGFTEDEMAEAIAYCRARGVKTNLTLNILVRDRERRQALSDAKFLYECGADALIVQDIGMAWLLHKKAPDLTLHASTQMTVHTTDGARQLSEIGFSRVVLSRECTAQQVREITQRGGLETEVFVHGALCMCYSGQCYLSSVIGRRSGNRGMCAQPCRLPYNGCHPLSLKDLSLADHIPTLIELGVSSLKIEGRMKRPEYTAVVTKIYADLIAGNRGPTADEREALRRVFSREGFTDGYFTGNLDKMHGTKTNVPMDAVQDLYKQAAARFAEGKEAPLVPVSFDFSADFKQGASLCCAGFSATAPVEVAQNKPTTKEMVERALQKTGGTPFYVDGCSISIEDGLVVPVSVLGRLRREVLEQVLAKRQQPPPRTWQTRAGEHDAPREKKQFLGFTASVRTKEQADALRDLPLLSLYAPPEVAAQTGDNVILPRIYSDSEQGKIEEMLRKAKQKGAAEVLCGNIGQLLLCKKVGLTPCGDFGLNAFSTAAMTALGALSILRQTLSIEGHIRQLCEMAAPMQTELVVYGYLPLMIFENCAIKAQNKGKCTCTEKTTYLTDRKGQRFALLPEIGCRNTLLNALPLYLDEPVQSLGISAARLHFTIEDEQACRNIAARLLAGKALDGSYTHGLYYRGVE